MLTLVNVCIRSVTYTHPQHLLHARESKGIVPVTNVFVSALCQRVSGGDLLSIPNVVINSAGMCDVDIRPVS